MIRASLSSSDRRCLRLTSARWLRHQDSGSSCHLTHHSQTPSPAANCSFRRHFTSRIKSPPFRHMRPSQIQRALCPSIPSNYARMVTSTSHRYLSSPMRPRPYYDFTDDDADHDNDGMNTASDSDSLLDWIERSPSNYDDLKRYEDLFPSLDRNSVSDEWNGEESLLGLLNRDDGRPNVGGRKENGLSNDGSLLHLLNNRESKFRSSEKFEDYILNDSCGPNLDASAQFNGHALKEEAYTETSLTDLLNEAVYDEPPLSDLLQKENATRSKYKHLQRLQLQLESESAEEAMAKTWAVWKSARDRSDHSTIPAIRRELGAWYASLTAAIELEQWMYLNGDYKSVTSSHLDSNNYEDTLEEESSGKRGHGKRSSEKQKIAKDRTVYGPLLCLLPPQKIAILLAHSALSQTVLDGENGTKVITLALQISQSIETEINLSRALRVRAGKQRAKRRKPDDEFADEFDDEDEDEDPNSSEVKLPDKWAYTATHLQRFLDEINKIGSPESKLTQGKVRVKPALVRKRCQEILLAEGFVHDSEDPSATLRPITMNDFTEWDPVVKVKLGAALIRLLIDHTNYSKSYNRETGAADPAFHHDRKKVDSSKFQGFISIHPGLLHVANKADLPETMLISQKYVYNSRAQPMVIPPRDWVSVDDGGYEVLNVDFMRTRQCKTQKDAIRHADLSKVFEGLNVLGRVPWKVNKTVLDVALQCWDRGVVLGDIPAQTDFDVPPLPERLEYCDLSSLDGEEKEAHIKARKANKDAIMKHFRFKQKNADLHSLRCSAMLKLNQAKKFQDFDEVFFPYNVDFRGRAYPVPPHLSIVGSDLCRALLRFAHPKPLGPNGLYWLKVHLANLAGADKMSFDGRAQYADDNMDNIRAAVNDPFGENTWWMEFDDPFQGLATCHEIVQAIDSGDHENYMCSLPVHMDGSCNGLQHYAALGRDKVGGKAVNLCIADKPQDVYSGVMHEVIRRVALDAEEQLPFNENKKDLSKAEKEALKKVKSARLVNGLIDRGVVKRTVMTSVYGVTYIGAKNQISEKIEEKLEEQGHDIDEIEAEIHVACGYLASLTMEVMGQLFTGARETMKWLTACARLISAQGQPVAFVSPVGVPVVQPYRQKRPVTVITLLQNVMLTYDSDVLPLHRQRQVSAFPPNFVHSLDSSHMLLTAVEMEKRGLCFSAVHDSYWTHPCDIEEMNSVLRECFIDLYKQPLLEDVKKRWELRYPSIIFPDLPECGDLDLNDVRSAPYFFQ